MILIDGMKFPYGCNKCDFRYYGAAPDRDCEGVPQGCSLTGIHFFDYYQDKPNWPKQRPSFCPLHHVAGKSRMKLFVVTSGSYSDYHIDKIFTDKEQASLYSLMQYDSRVEEFEVDTVKNVQKKQYVLVRYDWRYDEIHELTMKSKPVMPHMRTDTWYRCFEFTLDISNDRLYKSIIRYGNRSGLLNKIIHDKFAQWLYENDTTKEEMMRKEDEERKKDIPNYECATSSIRVDLTDFVKKYVEDHGVPPTVVQLIDQCEILKAGEEKG